jgi:dTDP-6-deoxy-L-talose 4-dehydrogenase (NAD+)
MKKVLVTGATGFIGNYVVRELLKRDCRVIATSASPGKAKLCDWYSKADYIPFDLKKIQAKENYFLFFGQPDLLVHLAWEGLPNYKETFHLEDNLPRHLFFIKNLVTNGLRDVTVTGTCLEYGKQEGCLSEEMPVIPSTSYGLAKNELRLSLAEWSREHHFSLKWIRLFYMYGKGQSPNSLLSQLQSAIERGDTVFNMSPGDQLRDYLPVEKVAEYIVRIALQNKETGVINCCSGTPVQVKQLVARYLEETKATIDLHPGYYPYSDIEPKNFWGDNSKLKKILSGK